MNTNSVHDLMQQGLREKVFPGAVLLVGKGEPPLFFKAYGKANLFSGLPMTRETVFDLASLTKPLATTLAVARLADQGRIGLDQPVAGWLPELAGSDKATITVRQLLCHQSGFPAHRLFYMTLKSLAPRERKSAVLDLLKHAPLAYQPGETTLYSDLGFMLLCRLVESGPTDRMPPQSFARCETGCWSARCMMITPGLPGALMGTPACSARPRLFFSSCDFLLRTFGAVCQHLFFQGKYSPKSSTE
ncbi:MAG: beta-lactamase family protein [Desulfosarcina sp.]|nr:beta-lactamase family protein [Desulfosarcina sp.]MBC2764695.1 beta-lactamase family protein [Desulfosarcina sp.]